MAQSSARCSLCQNFYNGKNKLAGGTSNKGSDRYTPAPTATRAFTPAIAPIVTPLIASGSADSSVIRYLKDNLQRILRTVLDFRPPALLPAPVVAAALHYEVLCKRPLKAWFLDIYWDKTHLECYNFFQQCKDHFATAGAMGPNRVSFAPIFLNDTALFQWQQY